MTIKDELISLKNTIDYILKRNTMDYYSAIIIRKSCVNVKDKIDKIFNKIEIDLNE